MHENIMHTFFADVHHREIKVIFRKVFRLTNFHFNFKEGLSKPPQSYWIASTPETHYPALEEDLDIEVAIIGGGMVGITTALLLKREGIKVAIIEADRILQGTTAHTTAKLTSQHSLIYDEIKNQFSLEIARQYAEANESAIHLVAKLVEEKNIDCDFSWQPAYVYTYLDQYIEKIQNEVKTASDVGIDALYVDDIPLPTKAKAAMRFNGQAQFHPRKYLLSLAEEVHGDGCYIFEQTRATGIDEGRICTVKTHSGKKVRAQNVVIASHFPFYDGAGMYFARIYPDRSYALGLKVKDKYPGGMYVTAEDPGRSVRSQPFNGGELLIVSGEHHKTGHGSNLNKHYQNLLDFSCETFEVEELLYRWSTQDYTTVDKIPYVGHLTAGTPNIYVATGFRKWGMTNSTASAMVLRDLIIKGESPWQEVYTPQRFKPTTTTIGKFTKENIDVAAQLIKGKLERVPDDVDIPTGEARVIEGCGQKLGAYRDQQGELHVVDITCTHMGCELKWNNAENTWDCPCHGSRFTYEGEIVDGPAHYTLKHRCEGKNEIGPNIT